MTIGASDYWLRIDALTRPIFPEVKGGHEVFDLRRADEQGRASLLVLLRIQQEDSLLRHCIYPTIFRSSTNSPSIPKNHTMPEITQTIGKPLIITSTANADLIVTDVVEPLRTVTDNQIERWSETAPSDRETVPNKMAQDSLPCTIDHCETLLAPRVNELKAMCIGSAPSFKDLQMKSTISPWDGGRFGLELSLWPVRRESEVRLPRRRR